jgi:hypothetical protein
MDCDYLPQSAIEKAWSKRIGQLKSIVDIREKAGNDATREALKYSCKPDQLAKWPISVLLEYGMKPKASECLASGANSMHADPNGLNSSKTFGPNRLNVSVAATIGDS